MIDEAGADQRMNKDSQVAILQKEADNAKAWFAKYAEELRNDPGNESLRLLKNLCRREFEKRWDMLFALGVSSTAPSGADKYPPIGE